MITALIVLVIVGVALYLLNLMVPMDARIKQAIIAVVLLFTFLYLIGVLTGKTIIPL